MRPLKRIFRITATEDCTDRHARHTSDKRPESVLTSAAFLILLLLPSTYTSAQPSVQASRLVVEWPRVSIYFSAVCNASAFPTIQINDIDIYENGLSFPVDSLWCPDSTRAAPITTIFVLDASASMAGERTVAQGKAVSAFIGRMDPSHDRAGIMWLIAPLGTPVLACGLTGDTAALRAALATIPVSGSNAYLDCCYRAIEILSTIQTEQAKSVIMLTDAVDTWSSHATATVRQFAQDKRVNIHTVGLGTGFNQTELKYVLAEKTGGKFYSTGPPSGLESIFDSLYTVVRRGGDEFRADYTARCTDKSQRAVRLTLRNLCGQVFPIEGLSFISPFDPTQFPTLHLQLGSISGLQNSSSVIVPVYLLDTIPYMLFPNAVIPITFDRSLVEAVAVRGNPGAVCTDTAGYFLQKYYGANLVLNYQSPVGPITTVPALLCELVFTSRGIGYRDTLSTDLAVHNPVFSTGCYVPSIVDGRITIYRVHQNPHAWIDSTVTFNNRVRVYFRGGCDGVLSDAVLVSEISVECDSMPASNMTLAGPTSAGAWIAEFDDVFHDATEHAVTLTWNNVCDTTLRLYGSYIRREAWGVLDSIRSDTFQVRAQVRVRCTGVPWVHASTADVLLHRDGVAVSGATLRRPANDDRWEVSFMDPCPDGRNHTVDLTWKNVCDSTLTFSGTYTAETEHRSIIVHGNTVLCSGDTLLLAIPAGFVEQRWSTGDSVRTIRVTRPGVYTARAITAGGCARTFDTVTVRAPIAPTITCNTVPFACTQRPVTLRIPESYSSPMWNDSVRGIMRIVTMPGQYAVTAIDSAGCAVVSDPFTVFAADSVTPFVMWSGPAHPCEGNVVMLRAEPTGLRYRWSTGDTTESIAVTHSGRYYVQAHGDSLCIGTSRTIPVQFQDAPHPHVQPAQTIDLCEGDSATIDAGPGLLSYRWNTGDSTRMIRVSKGGSYWATVMSVVGCQGTSDTARVIIYPRPQVPVIRRIADELVVDSAGLLQWFLDAVAIPGANSTRIFIRLPGDYTVRCTTGQGCSSTSAPFHVSVVSVGTPSNRLISADIHPNPARDQVHITVRDLRGRVGLRLYNALGRLMVTHDLDATPESTTAVLDIRALPRGYYLLSIAHVLRTEWRSVAIF